MGFAVSIRPAVDPLSCFVSGCYTQKVLLSKSHDLMDPFKMLSLFTSCIQASIDTVLRSLVSLILCVHHNTVKAIVCIAMPNSIPIAKILLSCMQPQGSIYHVRITYLGRGIPDMNADISNREILNEKQPLLYISNIFVKFGSTP